MAATRKADGALAALMQAALALPILLVPAKAAKAEVGEIGFSLLGYKERGLIKITEPILWGRATLAEVWEVSASAAVDIITGASPQVVTNISGRPVQSVTGASISDRRDTSDIKVTRRVGDAAFSVSRAVSGENDYHSHAFGLEARLDLNQRNTTLTAGYGKSNDRVGSSTDPRLDQPRVVNEYMAGVTQILSPLALVQSTLTYTRGKGWYNDPYKFTLSFYSDTELPAFFPDTRPDHRDTLAWFTRYRRHFPEAGATLQAEYRFYRDDWGIRAHTIEVAWQRPLSDRWSLRPALRYYTQSGADFYSPVVPKPQPVVLSSDQRLSAFGSLSPSLRAILRLDDGLTIEGTVGYIHSAGSLHLGGAKNGAYETLRAGYGLVSIARSF